MRPTALIAGAAFALAVSAAFAREKCADPDAPETCAAAQSALPAAKVLDIVGITRGIDALLKDLGAKVTDREIRIEMPADILFDFDSAALRPEAFPTLEKVAEVLKSHGDAPAAIEGHTDSKGADAYNMKLSAQRAESVKRWLATRGGIPAGRLAARGLGETRPVAPNAKPDGSDDPEGRQKNRRVEIVVKKG